MLANRASRNFYTSHETLLVAAGEYKLMFEEEVHGPEVGFMSEFANEWYPLTYYKIYVDGVEFIKVERVYAPMTDRPYIFNPPVVFKQHIRIYAFNEDTASHVMEVFCNGIIYYE